jgi:hypothetical protein
MGIPGPLPPETVQSPVLQMYIDSNKDVYYVTAALYPNGDLYLVHWADGDNHLPTVLQKVVAVVAVDHGVRCDLEDNRTCTFKRLSTGDIINVEGRTITLYDELGTDLFPHTKHEDFNRFKVLFPDKLGAERKRW